MQKVIFFALLLLLNLTACEKHKSDMPALELNITSFERPQSLFTPYIAKLDSEFTPAKVQYRIICKDFSYKYKTNYLPNLLRFASGNYDELNLITDLNIVLENYKRKDITRC